MRILNNNLPKQSYRILGSVKSVKAGKVSTAYRVTKQDIMSQATKMHADALLGIHYSQTPTDSRQHATVTITGVAIQITDKKYVNKLFKGVC